MVLNATQRAVLSSGIAIPDRIDYFEDGNLNNYEGDLDAFSITSNSLSGEYSLLMDSDPFIEILSLSG